MKSRETHHDASLYHEGALKECHTDTLLRLAFLEIEKEKAQAIQDLVDKDEAGIPVAEMDTMYKEARQGIARLIDREARKSRRRRFVRHILPKIMRVTSIVLLAIFLSGTTVFATIRPVRIRVLEFLVKMEDQYAELRLIERDEVLVNVPAEWKGIWYPGYIPEEFVLTEVGRDGYKLLFTSQDGRAITFTEYDMESEANMDIEDSDVTHISLHGENAILATKDGTSLVTWPYFDRYYLLRVDASPEEAIKIAEEMIRIR